MLMRLVGITVAAVALSQAFPAGLAAQEPRPIASARGWLGIAFARERVEQDGERRDAIVVRQVVSGSPADRAGIRARDIVLSVNASPADERAFDALARTLEPGDTVSLRLRREGRELALAVVADERPRWAMASRLRRSLAFDSDSLRRAVRIRLDSIRARLDSLDLSHIRIQHDSIHARIDSVRARLEGADGPYLYIWRGDPGLFFRFGDSIFPRFPDSLPPGPWTPWDTLPELDPPGFGLPVVPGEPFRDAWAHAMLLDVGWRGVAGAEFAELNPGLGRYFDADDGLLVLRVAPGTPAARAGLEPGDVVVAAGGRSAVDLSELRRAVMRAAMRREVLELEIVRDGERRMVRLPRRD